MSTFVQRFGPGLHALALVGGPLTAASSTFLWKDGNYGITGGTLMASGVVTWLYGFVGLYPRLAERAPILAPLWLGTAVVGALAGVMFGARDFFETVFGIGRQEGLQLYSEHPVESAVLLFQSGPAFPASILLLGVLLLRLRLVPVWVSALLMAGAMAFPVSRITRIAEIAHAADLLLLIPFAYLAWQTWQSSRPTDSRYRTETAASGSPEGA
jgi:hypothetical protein